MSSTVISEPYCSCMHMNISLVDRRAAGYRKTAVSDIPVF